ncbi:MAG: hypothetical protein AAFR52_09270 [Pseudomonadota bacterium]
MHPADALFRVREALRVLKLREAALKDALVAASPCDRAGRDWIAEVEFQDDRVPDRNAPPNGGATDGRFWRRRRTRRVVLTPVIRTPSEVPQPKAKAPATTDGPAPPMAAPAPFGGRGRRGARRGRALPDPLVDIEDGW